MFRQMLKLAVEAIKVEARRWLNPEPVEEAAPVVAAPVTETKPAPSKWWSTAYHMEVLGSSVCPECEQPKSVGDYFCKACIAKKRAAA